MVGAVEIATEAMQMQSTSLPRAEVRLLRDPDIELCLERWSLEREKQATWEKWPLGYQLWS